MGYSILGALGWLESDYEWINREIRREKRLEAIIQEEEKEERMVAAPDWFKSSCGRVELEQPTTAG